MKIRAKTLEKVLGAISRNMVLKDGAYSLTLEASNICREVRHNGGHIIEASTKKVISYLKKCTMLSPTDRKDFFRVDFDLLHSLLARAEEGISVSFDADLLEEEETRNALREAKKERTKNTRQRSKRKSFSIKGWKVKVPYSSDDLLILFEMIAEKVKTPDTSEDEKTYYLEKAISLMEKAESFKIEISPSVYELVWEITSLFLDEPWLGF